MPDLNFKTTVIFFLSVLIIILGGFYFIDKYNLNRLKETALEEFSKGDYATALTLYNKLNEKLPDNEEIKNKNEETKQLLVAEENFIKARQAAENGDWTGANVLLEQSGASENPYFKFYEEAKNLYRQTKEMLAKFEEETSAKINSLKNDITNAEQKASQTAKEKTRVESELQKTVSQKEQTETILESTKQTLEESQTKIAETQAQFEAEQQKTRELAEQAKQERFKKFINELQIYAEMLRKGGSFLDFATDELNKNNDVSALIYISQAKVLFDETRVKSLDLRDNRTPEGYKEQVEQVFQAADFYGNAVQNLRNAIIYIDNKNGEEFKNYFDQTLTYKNNAGNLVIKITEFISAN